MKTDDSEGVPPLGPLEIHVHSFLDHLRAAGYAPQTVGTKRSIATAFARWTQCERVAVEDLSDSHLAAFVERVAHRPNARVKLELAALRPFLEHLRVERRIAPRPLSRPGSPADDLAQRYVDYLHRDRGLAENSVLVYAPFARDFLTDRVAKTGRVSLDGLDAVTIRTFLLERTANRSSEYVRLLTVSLRSLFRFLFLRGETPRDLSVAVPTVRTYRQSGVPAVLSPEEVERVLAGTDQSTARGRRDHAILLLLARLGLRASEIMSLELSDLRWRTGEIIVRGKGPRLDHVPLLADVGEAVARYLRQDRGASASRRVFLRLIAPRIGLARPCTIDHIVRLALARVGLRHPPRRVAHLFRHGLATRMIRHGASIAEIAEILRHRSQSTTAIYAKVSFEALRGVARPWPATGGGR
ncbi:MAG: tyrosine-type recombinase/integrase [Gaiellales bacterium]